MDLRAGQGDVPTKEASDSYGETNRITFEDGVTIGDLFVVTERIDGVDSKIRSRPRPH